MRTLGMLFVLLLAVVAMAQTTTAIQPGSCIHLNNCVLYDVNGNTVWSDVSWNATTGSYGGFLEYGIYPNQQEFTQLVAYPIANPTDPNPADANRIIYSVEFADGNGVTYSEVLKGYSTYGCSGGRGGGCKTTWHITSGSLTIQ